MDDITPLICILLLIQLVTSLRRRQILYRRIVIRRMRLADQLRRWRIRNHRRRRMQIALAAALGVAFALMEEARPRRRTVWVKPRSNAVWDNMWLRLGHHEWREHFRMTKGTFQFICDRLRPVLTKADTRLRRCIPVEKKVAIALWRIATNIEFRTLGQFFGVGRSTACRVTHEVANAIQTLLEAEFLRFPTGQELVEDVNGFEQRWGFPQVAGAIDGSHIPILAPVDFPQDFYNRKGFYSTVLQAVVDYRYRFIDIFVGWPGSVHDARILANSEIYRKGQDGTLFPERIRDINGTGVPIMLLGDPAYPLLPWLMKGFSDQGRLRPEQLGFNYRLSRARMVVECAFGRLKSRWRCLLKRNDSDISKIPTLVAACCILHNICEERQDLFNPNWLVEDGQEADILVPHQGREIRGEEVRNALVAYFDQGN